MRYSKTNDPIPWTPEPRTNGPLLYTPWPGTAKETPMNRNQVFILEQVLFDTENRFLKELFTHQRIALRGDVLEAVNRAIEMPVKLYGENKEWYCSACAIEIPEVLKDLYSHEPFYCPHCGQLLRYKEDPE